MLPQAKTEIVKNFTEQLAAVQAQQARDEHARSEEIRSLKALITQKQVNPTSISS